MAYGVHIGKAGQLNSDGKAVRREVPVRKMDELGTPSLKNKFLLNEGVFDGVARKIIVTVAAGRQPGCRCLLRDARIDMADENRLP